jgi:hypothetical protein
LLTAAVFLCGTPSRAAPQLLAVKEWRGEYFKKKEGAVFVKTLATGFPAGSTGNFQVTLFNIIQQRLYTFSSSQIQADAYPREIWKLPSGKYRVERIEFTDGAGQKRVWIPSAEQKIALLVPRVMLANFGVWIMSPAGPSGMIAKFSQSPNTYKENGQAKDSSVAAVVNAHTGTIQRVIGGKKVLEGADNEYSDETTLRATTTFTRQISMFYKVNLFKHNVYSKDVSGALAAFDLNLRTCYTNALNRNSSLRGDVVLQVLVSSKTGTIRQARKSAGTLSDGQVVDCLTAELTQIPMPIQENMIGELTFTFDAKI